MQYDDPPQTHALNDIEDDREGYLISMYGAGRETEAFRYGFGDGPVVYMTLQDALTAFLIYKATSAKGFEYNYKVWLRTVTLIVAQAQREPELLVLLVYADPQDNNNLFRSASSNPQATRHEFTMTLTGSWDCLSEDTFKIITSMPRNPD
jgi:hypothetical protein